MLIKDGRNLPQNVHSWLQHPLFIKCQFGYFVFQCDLSSTRRMNFSPTISFVLFVNCFHLHKTSIVCLKHAVTPMQIAVKCSKGSGLQYIFILVL